MKRTLRIVVDYDDETEDTEQLATTLEDSLAPLAAADKVAVREIMDQPTEPR